MSDKDPETVEVGSLPASAGDEFFDALQQNPFVALVLREDGQVKVYAKKMNAEQARAALDQIKGDN